MRIVLISIMLLLLTMMASAQNPHPNDTIFCIVDTTNQFTQLKGHQKSRWQVNIEGSYYDKTDDEELALITLTNDLQCNKAVSGDIAIYVPRNNLTEKYTVITDDWLNQQTDLYILRDKIGFVPCNKNYFIIFKQDFDNRNGDKVRAFRILVEYGEVKY